VFKNCYAVGIPNSEGKIGILWATAIGALLPDPSLELECFKQCDASILENAAKLIDHSAIHVEALSGKDQLYIDCRVIRADGVGRVVISGSHTNVSLVEKNGVAQAFAPKNSANAGFVASDDGLMRLSFAELVALARSITPGDRKRIREGCDLNLAIAEESDDISQRVSAGVYARMSGVGRVVMSASGSGNKGITCSLPLVMYGERIKADPAKVEEALALSIIMTELTTRHLGTLSAICGCTNASGIGVAAGLVYLQGGGEKEISHAVSNMVGNISGIICDGAKIGCALKAMTAVEAAFRAAALAMKGVFIPESDGIVGSDGLRSLENLGRIANRGMVGVDDEVLQIMRGKLNNVR
jgi:L-cysteine desulfidase